MTQKRFPHNVDKKNIYMYIIYSMNNENYSKKKTIKIKQKSQNNFGILKIFFNRKKMKENSKRKRDIKRKDKIE